MNLLFREILPIELTNSPRNEAYRHFASSKIAKEYCEMMKYQDKDSAIGKLVKIKIIRYLSRNQKPFTTYSRFNGNFMEIREMIILLGWIERGLKCEYVFEEDDTCRDQFQLAGKTMIEVYEI